jgi:hypothetical protein
LNGWVRCGGLRRRPRTTHSTGARISQSFIVELAIAGLNARPVNSGVRCYQSTAKERAMKKTEWPWRLIFIFGGIIVASIISIVLILYRYWDQYKFKDNIAGEIIKSLLQIITVLVLGQVISFIIAKFNADRERAEAITEFKKEILHRLTHTYIGVLKQRRLLRAKGLTKPYIGMIQESTEVLFDSFDKQMQFINEVQGEIKAMRQEMKSSEDVFSEYTSLNNYIKKMEEYLANLIDLYEQKLGAFGGKGSKKKIKELEIVEEGKTKFTLTDFVEKAQKGNKFKDEFVDSYYAAAQLIRKDILE